MFKLSKKVSNAIYGFGAAIVIIGALMKITHFSPDFWPSAANTMLTIGLVVEAMIFAYSAAKNYLWCFLTFDVKDAPRKLLHGTVLKFSVRLTLAYFMTQKRFQMKLFV